jgi:hypothetical protein
VVFICFWQLPIIEALWGLDELACLWCFFVFKIF